MMAAKFIPKYFLFSMLFTNFAVNKIFYILSQ